MFIARKRGTSYSLIILLFVLAIPEVAAAPIASSHSTASASPVWTVSLDANSTSQRDVSVTSSSLAGKGFRVGAVINASSSAPLTDVYGWQFAIHYNQSAFVPQGDPSPSSSYPDGAENTVLYGSQSTPGTVNWAGLVLSGLAYGGSKQNTRQGTASNCELTGSDYGKIYVFLTLLAPTPAVTISSNTLLASVGFELLSKPSSPQSFNITEVSIVRSDVSRVPKVIAGSSVSETVTNDPPHAKLAITPAPTIGPFAYTFDASKSTDADDPIPNPSGYFWDFGDGSQDLGITGPLVTHDYGISGVFYPTLRVQDSAGATGSSRNFAGGVIANLQPSHRGSPFASVSDVSPSGIVYATPLTFSFSPSAPKAGEIILFTTNGTKAPFNCWNFGDGRTLTSGSPAWHVYEKPGNYTVHLATGSDGPLTQSSAVVSVRGSNASQPHLAWTDLLPLTPSSYEDPASLLFGDPSAAVSTGPAGVYVAYGEEVRGYDFFGKLLWVHPVGGQLTGIIASSDAVYAVGGIGNGAERVGFLKKYDFQGNLVWTRGFPGAMVGGAWASGVVFDMTGIYVDGSTGSNYGFVTKFDAEGNVLWTDKILNHICDSQLPSVPCSPVQDEDSITAGQGGIYVHAYHSCFTPDCSGVSFYSPGEIVAIGRDGKVLWRQNDTSFDVLSAGPTGIYGVRGYEVNKYDFHGNLVWTRGVRSPGEPFADFPISVSAGPEGAYVVGTREGYYWTCSPLTIQCIFNSWYNFVTYFDSNGNQLWTFHFPGDSKHYPSRVSFSAKGIFVAGTGFISKVDCAAMRPCDPANIVSQDPPTHHHHRHHHRHLRHPNSNRGHSDNGHSVLTGQTPLTNRETSQGNVLQATPSRKGHRLELSHVARVFRHQRRIPR